MSQSVIKLLKEITHSLSSVYDDAFSAEQVAGWLLEKLTKKTKIQLISQEFIELTPLEEKLLSEWVNEHVTHKKPVQYILGSVPFLDLTIAVEAPILIPRPETEAWVSTLIAQLQGLQNKKITLLDIGTGSGCIALALAKALPQATVYALDISEQALNLTIKNSILNGISNITVIESDVYEQLSKTVSFDIIISNPPYITQDEWRNVEASVTEWEDVRALVAPQEGLAVIIKIIAQAKQFLKKSAEIEQKKIPQLVIEIGYHQGDAVAQLMKHAGFNNVMVHKDISRQERVVTGNI